MQRLPKPQLWATATKPDPATAALTCLKEAQRLLSQIPGAEEDWDLFNAIRATHGGVECVESWQQRQGDDLSAA